MVLEHKMMQRLESSQGWDIDPRRQGKWLGRDSSSDPREKKRHM